MKDDVIELFCQIIELSEKPVVPTGELATNPSGEMIQINEADYGKTSYRAILDLGLLDVSPEFLIPQQKGISITGASSDMLVVDLGENVQGFAVGGVDYVIKPLRLPEVMARLATHVKNARAARISRCCSAISCPSTTLAVGAAMLAGRPHWYFLFEIVVLGAVLVAPVTQSQVQHASFVEHDTPTKMLARTRFGLHAEQDLDLGHARALQFASGQGRAPAAWPRRVVSPVNPAILCVLRV